MALDEDLRSAIVTIVGGSVPVQQGKVEDTAVQPRVWFRRANAFTDLFIGGGAGLTETFYDIEVHGTSLSGVQTLADSIKALYSASTPGLNGRSGTFGSSTILGCFVEDHADDYEPKGGFDSDIGMHVAALQVHIIQG